MRRTTTRSSTRSGSRRASSRSKRSKRATRPRLSALQVREILGVLFVLAAMLGLLGILSHAGSILGAIRDGMLAALGAAWFVPVVAAMGLGAYLLWPKAPRPRMVNVVAGVVAVVSLVGLFGLAARAGGAIGGAIAGSLQDLFTTFGAWGLLLAGLVIGLIVTVHFSPGALLTATFGAMRAANAERARIRDLVAAPATEKTRPAKSVPAAADAPARSAAILATTPPLKEQPAPWELDGPEPIEERKPRAVATAVHEEV